MPATTTQPEILPLLRDRWSTRLFDPGHELSRDEVVRLLEAARWSPSAGNSQPWAFVIARRGDEAHAKLVTTLSRGNSTWVPTASVVLLSLFRAGDDEDPSLTYSDYAPYDLGQSVAHLTVQAQSMGLSVHQFAGFDRDAATELFEVPPSWRVTTGIAIGVWADPAVHEPDPSLLEREQKPRERKELAEFVFGGTFGKPADLA